MWRNVNGVSVGVKEGSTVLQACRVGGIELPRFCYHDRLLVAGNCRMCRVERGRGGKLVASCALPVSKGIEVFTNRSRVRKGRESVREIRLVNHPLDCPICDQGGECDLQEESLEYGSDSSRFFVEKRGVVDKKFGGVVKRVMTRCIHCTRCVRFATEVAGLNNLGVSGRGSEMEIGTYVEGVLNRPLSGNLVDLCPVGALTSEDYAFKGRPWELVSTERVDEMDGFGSKIRIDVRGNEVVRVLPLEFDEVNGE